MLNKILAITFISSLSLNVAAVEPVSPETKKKEVVAKKNNSSSQNDDNAEPVNKPEQVKAQTPSLSLKQIQCFPYC